MRKGLKKSMSFVLSAAMMVSIGFGMTFGIASAGSSNDRENKTVESADDVKNGFRAMVAYQTSKYDCRNGYNAKINEAEVDAIYNA